jgi:hypothetical protein
MNPNNVPIELSPYNALTILSFMREFVNERMPKEYRFQAIREAVDEFEFQLTRNITDEQHAAVLEELKINKLIGKVPN